ncbi:SLAM family member 7-like isoform 3-T3 [Pholidichthys leucotaenia]
MSLAFVILAGLFCIMAQGSTSVTSEFVKKDSDFLLYINESAIPENFLIFRWVFKTDTNMISFLRGGDTEVTDSHSERIEFSKENHSVKLKRLQEADSGDYIARVFTPNKELTLVTYSIIVQEPVSPADLTVDHVSSSSHSCILTVTCSTGDSHISSNFTCDTRTCYQEGGEKPKVTASGAVLHLQLANQSIICNHSNQVSYEKTPRNIRDLCPNHADPTDGVSICQVKMAVFSVGLIIMVSAVITVHIMEKIKKQK